MNTKLTTIVMLAALLSTGFALPEKIEQPEPTAQETSIEELRISPAEYFASENPPAPAKLKRPRGQRSA